MNKPKKRFIAGAVCPQCGAMDSLLEWTDDKGKHVACAECNFEDKLGAENDNSAQNQRIDFIDITKDQD